jgi:parallel beta-helix repeat protein
MVSKIVQSLVGRIVKKSNAYHPRSRLPIACMVFALVAAVSCRRTGTPQDELGAQIVDPIHSPPSSSSALPGKLDPRKAVNAVEAGLVADSDEDQGKQLADLISKTAADPDRDTVYVPEGSYRIAEAIRLRPGVNLVGDGMGRTVFYRDDSKNYLVKSAGNGDFGKALVANLSFRNQHRTLLMRDVHHLRFHNVEFEGGIVRFEEASHITIEGCYFNRNLGKGGYASSNCKNIRIVKNVFNSIEKGSINLSGHVDCYVASNRITSAKLIDSGYAGIRLPNSAKNNIIENNFIENHGRGLFILSSSVNNVLQNNTVKNTTYQGVLIQASNNVLAGNTIMDAGGEAIYVVNATADSSPTPSVADNNSILGNLIYDTRKHDASRFVGLQISSRNNIVKGNRVSLTYGREFKAIRGGAGNQDIDNVYSREVGRQKAEERLRNSAQQTGH